MIPKSAVVFAAIALLARCWKTSTSAWPALSSSSCAATPGQLLGRLATDYPRPRRLPPRPNRPFVDWV